MVLVSPSNACLLECWRTVRIHAELVPVVRWNIHERGTALAVARAKNAQDHPHLWRLPAIAIIYLYGNYIYERRETFARTRHAGKHGGNMIERDTRDIDKTHHEHRALYMPSIYYARTHARCVSLFRIVYRFTTNTGARIDLTPVSARGKLECPRAFTRYSFRDSPQTRRRKYFLGSTRLPRSLFLIHYSFIDSRYKCIVACRARNVCWFLSCTILAASL